MRADWKPHEAFYTSLSTTVLLWLAKSVYHAVFFSAARVSLTLDLLAADPREPSLLRVPPDVGDVVPPGVDAPGADLAVARVEALVLSSQGEEGPARQKALF